MAESDLTRIHTAITEKQPLLVYNSVFFGEVKLNEVQPERKVNLKVNQHDHSFLTVKNTELAKVIKKKQLEIWYLEFKMRKLKKIKVVSFAIFQAILTTLLGLLCGVLYSFGGLLVDALVTMEFLSPEDWSTPGLSYGSVLAFGALLGMPIIFGIIGFLGGIVEAVLFNQFAKWFGGLKIHFEERE